ncbi:MAG: hypothetical protein NDJ92_02000 [Thermoanaerobaculia bacterium]|nr:hypothetical protein [Thermoanaerobaculia bacterium]
MNTNFKIERKEDNATDALPHTCSRFHYPCTTTTMPRNITCTIPKLRKEGYLDDVPDEAWEPARRAAREQFDAVLYVHDHPFPGSFHGREAVDWPHYLAEFFIPEDTPIEIETLSAVMDPFFAEVIAKYTRAHSLNTNSSER